MTSYVSPADLWRGGLDLVGLLIESQIVVAYRTLGLAGFRHVSPNESHRMVTEKVPAFTEAALAASRAAMLGKRPDEIMGEWVRPLRRETRSNIRRLGGRG